MQRREVIAGVRDQEGAVGGECLAGLELERLRAFDGDARALGRLAHRQVEQARDRFHVAHGQAHVAAPDVGHRNAAAVVGRGHAQRVALIEVRLQRLHPVAAVLVRGAGETPEAAGRIRQFMRRAAPAGHLQRSLALVAIVNLQHGEAGQALEESDLHALLDAVFGLAGDDVAAAGAVARVLEVLVRVTRRK